MTRDAFPTFAVDLAVASTAAERPNSLDGIDTSPLKSGALGWVDSGAAAGTLFRLDRDDSATTPDGTSVVQPLAGPGRWKALVGGAINGQGQILADTANVAPPSGGVQLSTIDTTIVPEGTLAYVRSVEDQYVLDKTSALSVDGITVVAPASGGGQWIRRELGNEQWLAQSDWEIDPANGQDEATGAPGDPIASFAELLRRWGPKPVLEQRTVVSLLNDASESVVLQNLVLIGSDTQLLVEGIPVETLHSGTLTGETTLDPATDQAQEITDAAIGDWATAGSGGTSLIGERIRLTSGENAGAVAWIMARLTATTVRTTPFTTYDTTGTLSTLPSIVNPAGDEDYVVERLPSIQGLTTDLYIESLRGFFGLACVVYSIDVQDDDSTGRTRCNGNALNNIVHGRLRTSEIGGDQFTFAASLMVNANGQITSFTNDVLGILTAGLLDVVLKCNNSEVTFGFDSMGQNSQLLIVNESDCQLNGNAGFFDAGNAGEGALVVGSVSQAFLIGFLYGTGNTGYGLELGRDSRFIVNTGGNTPTVQGAVGDVLIAGEAVAFQDAPMLDLTSRTLYEAASGETKQRWPAKGPDLTDADENVDIRDGSIRVVPPGTLTANRIKTLTDVGPVTGYRLRIVRQGTEAFTLQVDNGGGSPGTLATIPAGERGFMEAQWDGTDWFLVGGGTGLS